MNDVPNDFRLKIAPEIFSAYPDYFAMVIYAENIVNGDSDKYSLDVLQDAEESARSAFGGVPVEEIPQISSWHGAFRGFGAKPKKYFNGAEALLRRVLSGEAIPPINRIVDLYNAVSIKYAIPAGGEDWDTLTSDLTLIRSDGTEPFASMTSDGEKIDHPRAGEVVWADNSGVTVRRWNWRQCYRTRVTAETTRAYFVLDRLEPLDMVTLSHAGDELVSHLRELSPDLNWSIEILKGEE
jgi:DNA/RNA-binding domain of Phe-tRNA-synthetase-like protein